MITKLAPKYKMCRNESFLKGTDYNELANKINEIIDQVQFGFQGNQGPIGTQGIQGPQGYQGIQGTQGSQGSQGPGGADGNLTGPMGPQGAQGNQGNQGNQGLTGAGVQGAQGNQGTQGVQGTQGPQGRQGTTGDTGVTGLQGWQGNQGNQGFLGSLGLQGPQGNQGRQGNQGNQGLTGTTGDTGPQGNQGNQGVQGPQGAQGNQGNQGWQGVQGVQGTQGTQGNQGNQGIQGPQGNQGTQGITGNPTLSVDTQMYGFLNQIETTMSFNDSTYVFTLADTGSGWSYYRAGIKYTISGNKTATLSGTPPETGLYFIYIDSTDGTLTASVNGWTLLDTKVPVAIILWNNANTPKYYMGEERHTILVPRRWHFIEHFTEGSAYISGGVITGHTINSSTDTDKTFAVSEAVVVDEDIINTLTQFADPNGTDAVYNLFYRTGVSTYTWRLSDMPFPYTTTGYIEYDNAGTLTPGTGGSGGNKRWINSYLLFSNYAGAARFSIVPGRAIFSSLAAATAESPALFSWTGFPIAESVIAYQLTWHTDGTGKGLCQLAAEPKRINVATITAAGPSSGTDHESLSNLLGGALGDHYHLTQVQHTDLTDGGITTLHTHVGIQGNQGPQGTQGVQGAQGNTGMQGWQGNQGNQGAISDIGPQGNQGATGPQGVQGPQGTQGTQGAQGNQGWQGNQGNQGLYGAPQITVSATAPSNPNVNDLWYDIS